MIIMKASEAKNNFGLLMDKSIKEPIVITKYNRPYVVLISKDFFDELVNIENGFESISKEQMKKNIDRISRKVSINGREDSEND